MKFLTKGDKVKASIRFKGTPIRKKVSALVHSVQSSPSEAEKSINTFFTRFYYCCLFISGREIAHRSEAEKTINKFVEDLKSLGTAEKRAGMEGRVLYVSINPVQECPRCCKITLPACVVCRVFVCVCVSVLCVCVYVCVRERVCVHVCECVHTGHTHTCRKHAHSAHEHVHVHV